MSGAGPLQPAPLDSARFGLRVHRGTLAPGDAAGDRALLAHLLAHGVDVAILRGPAPFQPTALLRHGMPVLHADTLVYYECDLARLVPRALRNTDLVLSLAGPEDVGELEALVASTFDAYRSHYHANPVLDPADILAGYTEWALGHVRGDAAGAQTWIARRAGSIVAFACCADDGTTGEGVLYGVHPDHAGGGLYSDLIRHTQRVFADAGRTTMRVSTQVWNHAVQKVWSREGFWLSAALDTWHANALLSAGDILCDRTLRFSQAQVDRFAEVTGDRNPVHVDADRARDAGFQGTLAHGMLTGGELSRLFGMEAPGPGTLFLRASMSFIAPVYAGRDHRLVVRSIPRQAGRPQLAVATVTDADGKACVLGYCDLLRKER